MKEEINIELIALCLSKDGVAQRKLYDLLLPYLNALSKRYLYDHSFLKDVLQESFIRIYKSLDQFDVQKASFKTWSAKIAINSCLKYNAKNKMRKTDEFLPEVHDLGLHPVAIDLMSMDELHRWLKKMPKEYFEVFNLYIIDGFRHEEIAKLLNIKIALSRKRLSRARVWVKKRVQDDADLMLNFSYN